MTCELSMQCDLVYRFLKCALPEDTTDMDLKVHTLKGIHTFKKDYKSQTSKCRLWGVEVQPYPSLKKKVVKFLCQRQAITTPYANRPTIPDLRKLQRRETCYHLPSQIEENYPNEERLMCRKTLHPPIS